MAKVEMQLLLYQFLQKHQTESSTFTKEELIAHVGWKPSTFKSYYGKGQITQFLAEIGVNTYEAINVLDVSFIEFKKRLSQSKHYQELGHKCKSNLAKALLKKSKDNMMLALELYNRPSLENKLDGFVMMYSTAWEQLLKAIIIERDGEEAVFEKANKQGVKKTISFRQCLDKLFKENDNVRKNISRIADWRDGAVHLLMPELQGLASRIFQSGVLNYSSKFQEFAEVPFMRSQHAGMISLVGDFKMPPEPVLRSLYGKAAEDMLELAQTVQDEIEKEDDIEFAIPINVSLVYARDEKDSQIILAAANGKAQDLEQLKKALVVEKQVDPEKTHTFTQKTAIDAINKTLHANYDMAKLEKCLVARDKKGKPTINSHCFQAAVSKLNWKATCNKHHHYQKISNTHIYSQDAVDELVRQITTKDNFIKQAKSKAKKKRNKQAAAA
ncbi:DUF3644 domain-containing protein [Vibrio coralliilyticus]|uniref:DUF3644 domain-containing protein n=1 Tax=Vibrio coralliilyticus TaxID=190893 RepID=UPI000512970D|nr:DUF3644 domain-containing protein [Vibrio coralliilyticus]AIU66473.1 hypothetical protein JV59_29280 [Vibrio coralliilyticus]